MSKLDAQRAMREANYARRQQAATPATPRSRPPVAPDAPTAASRRRPSPAQPVRDRPAASADGPSEGEVAACGHRSMNGRACTREAGHPEKSHRYG